jgi:hypothetical protein
MTTPNLRDNAELRRAVCDIVAVHDGKPPGENRGYVISRILDAVQAALAPEAAPEQPRDAWLDARPASVPTPATCHDWATVPGIGWCCAKCGVFRRCCP